MNPRQPNAPRLGGKPSLATTARGNSPLLVLVQTRMASDELWKFRSTNDLWICPYCLSGVAKRPGLSHVDSIAKHLENCRHFALGKGQPQGREAISEKRNYESMVHAAQSDPAWRVYETDGVWISPFSLQRVPAVRATNGKLDNFLYQALSKHLAQCPFHRQGIIHPVDEVMLARELHRRIADVRRFTTFQMHSHAEWRWIDGNGHWICPYTLYAVPQVRLGNVSDWTTAPNLVAQHLITHCPRFATGQATPHPPEAIAQAAGETGRNVPPPAIAAPTPVSPTQILGTTTRTGLAILQPTPTSVPISGGSGASPVLVSASGAVPTLPAKPGENGQRSGGFVFNRAQRQPGEPTGATRTLPTLPPRRPTPAPPVQPAAQSPAQPPLHPPANPPIAPPIALPVAQPRVAQPHVAQPRIVEQAQQPMAPAEPTPAEPQIAWPQPTRAMARLQQHPNELPEDFTAALSEVGAQLAALMPDDELPATIPADEVQDLDIVPQHEDEVHDGDDLAPSEAPEHQASAMTKSSGREDGHLDWMDDADSSGHQEVLPSPRTDMIHARKLQETLLQQPPAVPGFQFATRYEACADITGDFFLFINLPDNRIGIALGDVSGHGVRAGLIMSMARKTLEIYATLGGSPADTLSRVNDALVADLGGKMFVSMIYGVLDPDEGVITWARAGHNPGLRYNVLSEQSGEIRPKGMVVGMKSGPLFRQSMEEEVTRLEPGDLFVLYTDGITETMNLQQEEFGTARLGEILRQFASDGPETVIEQIMDRLHHFRGPRPPNDDATMVALLVE